MHSCVISCIQDGPTCMKTYFVWMQHSYLSKIKIIINFTTATKQKAENHSDLILMLKARPLPPRIYPERTKRCSGSVWLATNPKINKCTCSNPSAYALRRGLIRSAIVVIVCMTLYVFHCGDAQLRMRTKNC